MNNHLLIIDPQADFCDGPLNGSLAVPGANDDMTRLADYILREGHLIDGITVTLDSHHPVDIGHPAYWTDAGGNEPAPFTLICADDVAEGRWRPRDGSHKAYAIGYLRALESGGRFVHTVWPVHCLVGSSGHRIHPALKAALDKWAIGKARTVRYMFKGLNPHTEHYSAFKAEVPIASDPSTGADIEAVRHIARNNRILVAGEALSHCVKSTVEDLVSLSAEHLGIDVAPKLVLLRDTMSPVPAIPGGPDFPAIGEAFLAAMAAAGARICDTGSAVIQE